MTTHDVPAMDRMLAAQASAPQVARELIAEARAGLKPFCDIPAGYRGCRLDHISCKLEDLSENETRRLIEEPSGAIMNPAPVHLQAMEFFRMILEGNPLVCAQRDPLRPTLGAYLVGPPGVGKTHIMAAFGLRIKQRLDAELGKMEATITALIKRIYENTLDQQAEWSRLPMGADNRWVLSAPRSSTVQGIDEQNDVMQQAAQADVQITKCLSPEDRFAGAVTLLRRKVRAYAYQPTDMLYLGFEDLFGQLQGEKNRRARLLSALETARVLFIDDIHPKGDTERVLVVQQLIERRYELGRPGTFLTTNLTAEELGAGDRSVAQRLLSRCSENFIKFEFKDCADWRLTMKSRRIGLIEKAIVERLRQANVRNRAPDANNPSAPGSVPTS